MVLNKGLEIYYSDMDSLVLNGSLPEDVIDSPFSGICSLRGLAY
jgi:hypothetical protein